MLEADIATFRGEKKKEGKKEKKPQDCVSLKNVEDVFVFEL